MRIIIKVDYSNPFKYRKFCYALLNAIKNDMILNLDRRKLDARKDKLDKKLSVNLDYYQVYCMIIRSMYIEKDTESDYYSINFDESIKIKNIKLYFIFKIIEYGVVGIEPYPFMRFCIYRYNQMMELLYSNYCEEGNIDLSLRRSNNRRSQGSVRR